MKTDVKRFLKNSSENFKMCSFFSRYILKKLTKK